MDRLLLQLPLMQPDKLISGMAQAQAMYARMGVTTAYEGHVMDRPLIEAYRFLRQSRPAHDAGVGGPRGGVLRAPRRASRSPSTSSKPGSRTR